MPTESEQTRWILGRLQKDIQECLISQREAKRAAEREARWDEAERIEAARNAYAAARHYVDTAIAKLPPSRETEPRETVRFERENMTTKQNLATAIEEFRNRYEEADLTATELREAIVSLAEIMSHVIPLLPADLADLEGR